MADKDSSKKPEVRRAPSARPASPGAAAPSKSPSAAPSQSAQSAQNRQAQAAPAKTAQSKPTQSLTGKKPPIVEISLILMAVALILMVVLALVPRAGRSTKNPVLAIYGADGNMPSLSLTNTLHAAGFEYEMRQYGQDLPSGNDIVVCGVGEEALSLINEFKNNESVSGFILICPTMNETYLEGITGGSPECDIAIFAGRDNSDKAVDMDDARLIYERISGDDTIFGIPVRRGGLLASKVFVSNAQNRTLSLSFFNVNDPATLLFSPLFQNELAGYLSVTYIDEATRETSFGRINSWFVLTWMAFALAAVSVLLYLSNLGLSVTGNDTKKAPVSMWVFGVIGGTSIALAIGIIASSFVDALHAAMPFILVLLPLIFMTALFIINFTWITTKDGKFVPHRNGLIPAVFLAVVMGLFIMLILALTTDLQVYRIADPGLASGVLAFILVLDTTVASGLIYASRKSSTAGEGAKNCFGNLKIFLLMLIPAAASLLFGIMPWHREILYCGLGGLAATGIPFLAVLPLVRHTDRSLIPGILHGIIYTLVLAAVL